MFYGKDSIEENFSRVLKKLGEQELFLFEPMPKYKEGERWTDEFRIRDGHTKLADGSWVTIHKLTTYVEALQKNTVELYDNYQDALRKNDLVVKKNREMEYGLRVAEKALKNSLALTKEMINE
jgi:hypothetical protein